MARLSEHDGSPRLCLNGAAPDTGNLGVTALCYAVLGTIAEAAPEARVTVCDHGRGVREDYLSRGNEAMAFQRVGVVNSRRFYRPDNLWQMRVRGWLGWRHGAGLEALTGSDAVLDISGGDSFTDLYGRRRFETVTLPKRIALEHGCPLVLLPQTYGPFEQPRARRVAEQIVRRATAAWSRDRRSFEVMRDLAGNDFDVARHHCGVDVAFALPRMAPAATMARQVEPWFFERLHPVAGFNVSGLIWNDPQAARRRYGFRADYGAVVEGFLRRLLARSDGRVLLIPHVVTPLGHYESDIAACQALAARLNDDSRVMVLAPTNDPRQVKWVISHCDWFCGTRMHAAIAALSTGVPTAAIAYSDKTAGVFEMCGQAHQVVDPRTCDSAEAVERLWASWADRAAMREDLRDVAPFIVEQARRQMSDILAACGVRRTLMKQGDAA